MDHINFEPETETGIIKISAWAKDKAGNEPWLAIDLYGSGCQGFASMTFAQAEAFAKRLLDVIEKLRTDGQ